MKITLIELRMIIREEILAEKKRRRKKKKKDVFQNDMTYYPRHQYPYHLPPSDSVSNELGRRRDEDYEMYYSGIELM